MVSNRIISSDVYSSTHYLRVLCKVFASVISWIYTE